MTDKNIDFKNIGYDDFRKMAGNNSLSRNEKIGFPDEYRDGKDETIFSDILSKLPGLSRNGSTVLDIGPGCGPLADLMINHCGNYKQELVLLDSEEMLAHLPERDFIVKIPGFFPDSRELVDEYRGKFDAIIIYSVFHYLYVETDIFRSLDTIMDLLADGGAALIADIPNISKRKRFFASPTGVQFHKQFTNSESEPDVKYNLVEHKEIDDSVIFAMLMRARNSGCDSYVVSQRNDLPMANRREDIIVCKP